MIEERENIIELFLCLSCRQTNAIWEQITALQDTIFVSWYQFLLAEANSNLQFVFECLGCAHVLLGLCTQSIKFGLSQSVSQNSLYSQLKVLLRFYFHVI